MASVNDGVWRARKPLLAPVQRLAYVSGGILRDGRIGDGFDILLRACPPAPVAALPHPGPALSGAPRSSIMDGIRGHPRRRTGLSRFGELTRSLGLRRADLTEMDLTVVIYGGHAYP